MPTAAPTGFLGFISTYGSIIGFFIQMAFYIVVAAAALWAAIVFNRYVKYMVSDDDFSESSDKSAASVVSVEEFVE
jgi:hypothetical protein